MAAPVDAGRATTNISTAGTPWTINLPGSIASGNLLLFFARSPSGAGITTFTGWTGLSGPTTADASDDTMIFYGKIADGSESGTVSVTPSASSKCAAIIWKITGQTSANPLDTEFSAPTATTAANINPASYTTGHGSADWLFLSAIGMDSETGTASNGTLSNVVSANSGTGGAVASNCIIWGGSQQNTGVSSVDIAAWTSSAPANGCSAFTVGVWATSPPLPPSRDPWPWIQAVNRASTY